MSTSTNYRQHKKFVLKMYLFVNLLGENYAFEKVDFNLYSLGYEMLKCRHEMSSTFTKLKVIISVI